MVDVLSPHPLQRTCDCGGTCEACRSTDETTSEARADRQVVQRRFELIPGGASAVALQRQIGGNTAPGPSGETEVVRPCGMGDTALAFTTWALAAAKLGTNVPALQLASSLGVMTDNLKKALLKHFGVALADTATQTSTVNTLLEGYKTILKTLLVGIDSVSCGGTQCRPGDYAYVYPGAPVRIFFCDTQQSVANLFKDPLDLASTWVHEVSHEVIGTKDVEYYNHASGTTLATPQALTNADCWGNFSVDY